MRQALSFLKQPLRQNARRGQLVKGTSIPAPVGGLNAVDEFGDMDARDALILDNFFPNEYNVSLRRGFASHVTGLGATVETLMTWNGPTSSKMFGGANGKIYNVTTAGAVGAADISGLSSNRWQWTNFATSGGNFLVIANGADSVRNYNGSAWSTPTISSVTSSTLISVMPHKGRLWFIQKNTTDAWYLPAKAIAGTAVKYPLGSFFRLGGKLQAMGTISHDAGLGPDDYMCFLSSMGEVLVYQGTDPASSSTWALVGNYRVGYPVGDRPTVRIGGDLIIITSDGAVSLEKMLSVDRAQSAKAAVSYKIQPLFNTAVQNYSANFGWQGAVYPKGKWVVFNVPISTTRFDQYVMNALTGAWCHFTNMNGSCWGTLSESLYFGGTDGTVYKADTGSMDNTGPTYGEMKPAWNYLGSRGINKMVTMVRPVIQSNGQPSLLLSINTDFSDVPPTGSISFSAAPNTTWGSAKWGSGKWGGNANITTSWFTSGAIGYCIAVHLKVAVQGQTLSVNSFDIQAQPGGPI